MREVTPRWRAAATIGEGEALVAVPLDEDGRETTLYFVDEVAADAALGDDGVREALGAIGGWSHLDWEQAVDALDRMRHASWPTPPIEPL